ncbi:MULTISPECIES: hypothetical protein [Pseudomonas]|uniref:Uncharacterized protein n=1 Tax=Pseudomonas fluorescens TaxID=294 RepID=A0A166QLG4_PSEFL|nr:MULTISPECIES: hypothetical protein [Pseudomonas]KZN20470.1 hypothetical protein A1D17_02705 [Pseudomonas fluorescens]
MQSQFDFEASTPRALTPPGAGMNCTASECEVAAIRSSMTEEQISAERQLLTDRGMHRYDTGDRTGLGGPRGHQGCGSAFFVLDWFTDDELARFHHLGLALPSTGELVGAARQRIRYRIALRRANKPQIQ